MLKLNINIDHVAAIRQVTERSEPDPLAAAVLAQIGGAEGVSASWLSDEQSFQVHEYVLIRQIVQAHLNLIVTPTDEIVQQILAIQPDMVTLVPTGYRSAGLSMDWVNTNWPESDPSGRSLDRTISVMKEQNILVNMLIRPSATDVRYCSQLHADYVHIDATQYVTSENAVTEQQTVNDLASTATVAARLNMGVSVGRGLNYQTIQEVAAMREVEEAVVGHSVMSKALSIGFERAVRDMIGIIRHAPKGPGE
ncbi:MAG: hypothetical protein HOH43_13175 [Candidatus Latescibacteria bacterium]|jgi:pyridoxine 5-phosphate synthase|nr:hypothetical protein [Candidatus Latescibacterota bacterium]